MYAVLRHVEFGESIVGMTFGMLFLYDGRDLLSIEPHGCLEDLCHLREKSFPVFYD